MPMAAGNAIVLVDAGFLLKALLIHVGMQNREDVEVDYAGLTEALTDVAEQETGRRVLRQIWYDAARNGRARPEHRALGSVPGVHVRLGWIIDTNRGPQQKAVDTALVRDLVVGSVRRVADDVVLIAGDGDLAPGLEEAVERGLRVHLWGVSSADPRVRQSEALIALADQRLTLELADLGLHVRKRGLTEGAARGSRAVRRCRDRRDVRSRRLYDRPRTARARGGRTVNAAAKATTSRHAGSATPASDDQFPRAAAGSGARPRRGRRITSRSEPRRRDVWVPVVDTRQPWCARTLPGGGSPARLATAHGHGPACLCAAARP